MVVAWLCPAASEVAVCARPKRAPQRRHCVHSPLRLQHRRAPLRWQSELSDAVVGGSHLLHSRAAPGGTWCGQGQRTALSLANMPILCSIDRLADDRIERSGRGWSCPIREGPHHAAAVSISSPPSPAGCSHYRVTSGFDRSGVHHEQRIGWLLRHRGGTTNRYRHAGGNP